MPAKGTNNWKIKYINGRKCTKCHCHIHHNIAKNWEGRFKY